MTDYLGCKNCSALFEVSEEDPDSTLSDAVAHQVDRHGVRVESIAMRSITEVTK